MINLIKDIKKEDAMGLSKLSPVLDNDMKDLLDILFKNIEKAFATIQL